MLGEYYNYLMAYTFEIGMHAVFIVQSDWKGVLMDKKEIIKCLNSTVDVVESTFTKNNLAYVGCGFSDIDDDGWMVFHIEISSVNGSKLPNDVDVVINLYDEDNTIIFSSDCWIDEDRFGGYDTLSIDIASDDAAFNARKSRVFVRKA